MRMELSIMRNLGRDGRCWIGEEGRAVGHSDHFNITHMEGVNAHSEKGGTGGWESRKG